MRVRVDRDEHLGEDLVKMKTSMHKLYRTRIILYSGSEFRREHIHA
jgi:hypothetical protein